MNVVDKDVRNLVAKELTADNKIHPLFASNHEAYAVTLEELEEAEFELEQLKNYLAMFWSSVKKDENFESKQYICQAYEHAVSLADETIQAAAMCQKATESINKRHE